MKRRPPAANPPHSPEGASNFRDLGGLPTHHGGRLRRGMLYRSDALTGLTAAGLAQLAALGLRTVIDLRDPSERRVEPNRLPPDGAITEHSIGFLPVGARALIAALGPDSSADLVHSALTGYYRRFAREHTGNFADMFALLGRADSYPVLIHCTSGKDRTGFAIALLLSALGVPQADIREDYLRSNAAPRDLRRMLRGDVGPAALDALMRVRPEYLDAAFEAIEADWQSIEAFLEGALGVDTARRRALQASLIE